MDRELVDKLLAHVVDTVEEIRRLGRPERLADDPVQRGYVIHALQTAVQAVIDVASIIVAQRRLGEPANNRELFAQLASDGWISQEHVDVWKRIVGFRNVVVHRYLSVKVEIVRSIVESHLDDLLAFVAAVRKRLG